MTKLTLGPIVYHWPADKRRDFYARIADEAPVDEVYLGEVICSKRAPFHEGDLPEIIARLERGGKTVVLSTLAEVMLKRERKATGDIATMDAPEIEINNAAGLYARGTRPHRIGPFMNAYNEATIAVSPSVYEGFGFPCGEAMSCGTPVIATNGGSLPEVVGDAGIVVQHSNPPALAEAIAAMLDDPEMRARYGQAGRERILAKFKWERAARECVDVYRQTIADADNRLERARA